MRMATVPEYVMRTGAITVFDPRQARTAIGAKPLNAMVRTAVGRERVEPDAALAPSTAGTMLGQDASGRPMRQFDVPGMPSSAQAQTAVSALKEVAMTVRKRGLANAVTPLVAGPLAALVSGEAVVIRFTNGVAISAAL